MIRQATFDYMVDYLCATVGPSIEAGYGSEDASPKRDKESQLCDLFERYVYSAGMGMFLLSDSGVLYVYNGHYYEQITTKTFLQEVIKRTLERMRVGLVYQKISNKFISNECFSGMENSENGQFKPDRRYIVFNNGVFDVKEGKLKEFDKKYKTDLVLDIDYDGSAISSLWESKLVEIIPNSEMREAFQQFCGTLLINRAELKFEYICYLVGPGSNGKSVVASAVAAVFGEKYFGKFAPSQLLKSSDAMFNLASLEGMIANFTDDLDQDDISGGMFKRFVSGDTFQARHPFGRVVFKVAAPLMLCCANNMPSTTDDSWGHHRRQLPIYSSTRVWGEKDKDPYLAAKLSSPEARTAIFNWIYAGYRMIMANGGNIKLGQTVVEAQLNLRDDSNSARRWIRDCGLVKIEHPKDNDPNWQSLAEWHRRYTEYCKENGDRNPQNSKSLSRLFKEKEYVGKKTNKGMAYCIGQAGDSVSGVPVVNINDADLPF